MHNYIFINLFCCCVAAILAISDAQAQNAPVEQLWPQGSKVAISLSYDDALNSQLDKALPDLNVRYLKASFYVVPTSVAFINRMDDWRALAAQGHELGNHTLYHACLQSKPNRDWVEPTNALEQKIVSDMLKEVKVANTLLMAVNGQNKEPSPLRVLTT